MGLLPIAWGGGAQTGKKSARSDPSSVAHPCTSRAEVLAVLREHIPSPGRFVQDRFI
jgi:hypothetical protein